MLWPLQHPLLNLIGWRKGCTFSGLMCHTLRMARRWACYCRCWSCTSTWGSILYWTRAIACWKGSLSFERWGCLRVHWSKSIRAGLPVSPGIWCRQGLIGLGRKCGISTHSSEYRMLCSSLIGAWRKPNYLMRVMVTGGPNSVDESRQWVVLRSVVTRRSPPPSSITSHRHGVSNHNNLQHVLPSVEDSWTTHSLYCDTSSLATMQSNDVWLSWSFVSNWLGSWSTTFGFDRRNRFWLKWWPWLPYIGWSLLQTLPGNGRVELSFVTQPEAPAAFWPGKMWQAHQNLLCMWWSI